VDIAKPRESLEDLTRRVRAGYGEMPGLSVTLAQAQRLWDVDRETCESIHRSRDTPNLRKTESGRFVRM
jgi:hypothetical protein